MSIVLEIDKIVIYSSLSLVGGRLNVFDKDIVKTDARTIGGWVKLGKILNTVLFQVPSQRLLLIRWQLGRTRTPFMF